MYFLIAFIAHLFGSHTEYPYTTSETEAPNGYFKCCICKKNIKKEK